MESQRELLLIEGFGCKSARQPMRRGVHFVHERRVGGSQLDVITYEALWDDE